VLNHGTGDAGVGRRIAYWKKSLALVAEAPLRGHGTGTIPMLFRRDVPPGSDPMLITTNPHNQALTIAIQLGFLGVILLVAMWISHLSLFRARSLVAWFGLVVVVQNIVGSFFNSHLFDFGHGWLYVLAVGILGGTLLRSTSPPARIGHGA
jgi:O-antigen ligase